LLGVDNTTCLTRLERSSVKLDAHWLLVAIVEMTDVILGHVTYFDTEN